MRKGRNRMTNDEYIAELNIINPNIEVVGTYVDANTKIEHRCKICGYSWPVKPYSVKEGRGCPNCNRHRRVSLKELKLYYYIKKYFPDAISSFADVEHGLSELDIYIPSIKYGFEFDGTLYHQDIDRDKHKDNVCNDVGIKLIRIREAWCPIYDSTCGFIYLNNNNDSTLQLIVTYILEALGINNPDVNFKRDMTSIYDQCAYKNQEEKSLISIHPEIAAEWHPTKNGALKPEHVICTSTKEVWWLCSKCQNEWQKSIWKRTVQGRGCPRCTHHGVAKMVYCIETHEIFISISEASRQYKINKRYISRCCLKQRNFAGIHPITGERLHWYYVEDKYNGSDMIAQGAISLGLITQDYVNNFIERSKI